MSLSRCASCLFFAFTASAAISCAHAQTTPAPAPPAAPAAQPSPTPPAAPAAQPQAQPQTQPAKGDKPQPGTLTEPQPAPTGGTPKRYPLDNVRVYEGVWGTDDKNGDGKPDNFVTYRSSSGGAVMIETFMPGTRFETTSVYAIDGDDIIAHNFSLLAVTSRLRATYPGESAPLGNIEFTFQDKLNAAFRPDGAYIKKIKLTRIDRDNMSHELTYWRDGPNGLADGKDEVLAVRLSRVKDPAVIPPGIIPASIMPKPPAPAPDAPAATPPAGGPANPPAPTPPASAPPAPPAPPASPK